MISQQIQIQQFKNLCRVLFQLLINLSLQINACINRTNFILLQMQPKQNIPLRSLNTDNQTLPRMDSYQFRVGGQEQVDQRQSGKCQGQFRDVLTPANPIIDKYKSPDQQINVRFFDGEKQYLNKRRDTIVNNPLRKSKKMSSSFQKPIEIMTLFNGYDQSNRIFRKFNNQELNQLNKKRYFSSIFFSIFPRQNNKFQMGLKMPQYEGMNKQIDFQSKSSLVEDLQSQLDFGSNFQSGNLFAVYKTGTYTYDLILQNDINTTGSTQWFHFSVNNKKNKDIIVKFNIVNLYKTSSLYNKGMKPMVNSTKSSKGWIRKGHNIFYEKNCIKRQGSNKYYSSLSFSIDFTKQDDTVQFAHAIPYTYTKLLQVLKVFESSKKCVVKSLGTTPSKNTIPMVKFESQNPKIAKKAIIIMARQHPGQVQGSFAVQQILLNLIKSSTQIQFLLWRFNIYVIPMVNVDGVFLGNYRCNAMGYDLNRNWQGQEKSKYPQIVYIKSQIKKIMNKYPIELILDLHGHSNKMNSFFYGNPFGPNPYFFPYVAARQNPFITFGGCTFSQEKKQKAKTARSVLGSLIKQTGNVYTYQMSFHAGLKNGKVTNFYEEHYRQLGRELIATMHKVYVETYKQEKTLKESLYLKEVRKQISNIQPQFSTKSNSGSDHQAQSDRQQVQIQRKQEIQYKIGQIRQQKTQKQLNLQNLRKSEQRLQKQLNLQSLRRSEQIQKSLDSSLTKIEGYSQHKNNLSYGGTSRQQRVKRNTSLKDANNQSCIFNFDGSMQEKIKRHKIYAQKLRIFGQNLLTKPSISKVADSSQQFQTLQSTQRSVRASSIFQDRSRQAMNMNFAYIPKKSRSRQQNSSTLSPSKRHWKEQQGLINDIVRVNRLEYKKIEREKNKFSNKKSPGKSNSKRQGVFKLPSIIGQFKH